MASNTNLTFETARALICGKEVICPACGKEKLAPRYRHKNTATEFKCPACGEIFHATKEI